MTILFEVLFEVWDGEIKVYEIEVRGWSKEKIHTLHI